MDPSADPTRSQTALTPTWSLAQPLPTALTEAGAAMANHSIWVIGGILEDPGGGTQGMVQVLDPAANTWRPGPSLPTPVHHAAVTSTGSTIWVIGGFIGSPQFTPTAATWRLDADNPGSGWQPGPPLPKPRGAAAVATDGAMIWLVGGMTGSPVYQGPDRALLDDEVLRLDPGAAIWAPVGQLPDSRDHLCAAYVDHKVLAIGGRDLTLDTNTNRVDIFDALTGAWSRGADMPTPRGGLGCAVLDDAIIVVGGESTGQAFKATEAYHAAADSWSVLPPMLEARHGVATASYLGSLYVVGGGPAPAFTYSTTVQVLTNATLSS